jgi:hypothetical protein
VLLRCAVLATDRFVPRAELAATCAAAGPSAGSPQLPNLSQSAVAAAEGDCLLDHTNSAL